MARRKEPVIPDAILDQLLAGADAKTAFDQNGLLGLGLITSSRRQRRCRRRHGSLWPAGRNGWRHVGNP